MEVVGFAKRCYLKSNRYWIEKRVVSYREHHHAEYDSKTKQLKELISQYPEKQRDVRINSRICKIDLFEVVTLYTTKKGSAGWQGPLLLYYQRFTAYTPMPKKHPVFFEKSALHSWEQKPYTLPLYWAVSVTPAVSIMPQATSFYWRIQHPQKVVLKQLQQLNLLCVVSSAAALFVFLQANNTVDKTGQTINWVSSVFLVYSNQLIGNIRFITVV